jgi:hypothetical protein
MEATGRPNRRLEHRQSARYLWVIESTQIGYGFKGNIDELKISNASLSSSQISEIWNNINASYPMSLIANWSFEHIGYDLIVFDGSGNNHHLVATEGKGDANIVSGIIGRMYYSGNYPPELVVMESRNHFTLPSFTFESIIIPMVTYKPQVMFSHSTYDADSAKGYMLKISKLGNLIISLPNNFGTGWIDYTSQATIIFNDTNHIAITYEAGNINFFINGTFAGSAFNPYARLPASSQAVLGMSISKSGIKENFFKGYFDEVKLYNKALSSNEVFEHYNQIIP